MSTLRSGSPPRLAWKLAGLAATLGAAASAGTLACSSDEPATPPLLGGAGSGTGGAAGSSGTSGATGTSGTGDGGLSSGLAVDASVSTFATLPTAVVGLAAQAGGSVFATGTDGIVRAISSAGAVTAISGALARASAVTFDASYVYVVIASTQGGSDGAIDRIELATGTVTTLASSLLSPTAVSVDLMNVYWIDGGIGAGLRVASTPLAGGGVVSTLATYSSFGTPGSLVVSDGIAYFTDLNNGEAELLTANLVNGSQANFAQLLGETPGTPTGLVVESSLAFVTTGAAGGLFAFESTDAGTPTRLVASQTNAIGLQQVGTEVVWVEATSGALEAYDTLSGASGTLLTGFPSATATAVGDAFYVAYNNGIIGSVTF